MVKKRITNNATLSLSLWLSKRGNIPIRYHRPVPDHATIKEATVKTETTGDWYVSLSLSVEVEDKRVPEKTPAEELESDDCVGIDLAWLGLAWLGLAWLGLAWLGLAWLGLAWLVVLNSLHTSDGDGVSVDGLDWTGLDSSYQTSPNGWKENSESSPGPGSRPDRFDQQAKTAEAEAGC
ncbi:hypothetical protein [Haloquadratum walsbyi]|uniref:Transposase n=1 Tax=Haloquadratum walsbyi J07HQW2 TaxID=1238425 RepID=U1NIW2_9EURY|nr:MAG: hypothetical protein J07HQW2_03661 [Haloquadratum walsbyi J07HQW2]